METNELISVIVPVYNVEKYLDRCLDSLVNQTFNSLEIIVINDGTKDNSQSIIERYVNNYPNKIKSYIKENGGLGDARNYGVKYATGEYLTFLDSDDYVEKDLYENMYRLAKENNSDLVVGDLEFFWEDGSRKSFIKSGFNNVCNDRIKCLFLSPLFAWNKLYKKEIFDKLNCKYPVGLWYEDIPVTLKYISEITNVSHYDKVGYHYTQRKGSILGSSYSDKMYDIFKIFENVIDDFKQREKFMKYYNELEYLFVEHFLVYGAFRFLRTDHYRELMNKSFDFVKKHFPNYHKNIYLSTLGFKNNFVLKTNNKITDMFWHWYLINKDRK